VLEQLSAKALNISLFKIEEIIVKNITFAYKAVKPRKRDIMLEIIFPIPHKGMS